MGDFLFSDSPPEADK